MHTYAQNGSFTVTLTLTDGYGANSIASTQATVTNVAPSVAAFGGATLLRGETYSVTGSFSDPGTTETYTATVNYGDGSGDQPLSPSGRTFAFAHTYAASGTFPVTVRVSDGAASGMSSALVTVQSPLQGIANLNDAVTNLAGTGALNAGQGTSLRAKLNAASSQCRREGVACTNILNAFVEELKHYDGDQVDAITRYAERVIASATAAN